MQFHYSTHRTGIIFRMIFIIAMALHITPARAKECFVYFGTYTDTTSKGIYVSRLDMDSGKLSAPQLAVAVDSPNYLAVSPNGRILYVAVREKDGKVGAFAIDGSTGNLKLLDEKSSDADGLCYVGTDAAGQCVFAANYGSGSVKSFHVNPDGTLTDGTFIQHHGSSINSERQTGPHAHCFVGAPAGKFALVCDLGLDKIMIYKVDSATAALTPNDPPFATVTPGSGPRHIAFSPDGKTACVISEMACTVTAFDWNGKKGRLKARQTVPLLPADEYDKTFTAAEIAYRPDGRFVYATVRGHHKPGANSISVLAVNGKHLSLVQNLPCDGDFPRGMGVDPSGRWLIIGNQKSGTVTVFGIDASSGKLTPTGQVLDVGSAVDVKFAPTQ